MLKVSDLCFKYEDEDILKNVSFCVAPGEVVGLVGESGSGKSTIINSILGVYNAKGKITGGDILFENKSLIKLSRNDYRKLRGKDISFVSQYPEQSLDPVFKVKDQIYEIMKYHRGISGREAYEDAIKLFSEMEFTEPDRVLESYPFQLSGGMCQRVAIAMALCNNSKLMLADEFTSALDVITQKHIIGIMNKIRKNHGLSILFASHNMGAIAAMADKIAVVYNGKVVEFDDAVTVLNNPVHEYTRMLINSIPKL